jgi:molecular chaperone GrpE
MKDVPEDDPAKIGFNLIFSKFKDFLRQNNIKEIEAGGTVFNVDLHFALTKIPAPTEELKGKVVDVIEKGYLLNDKVLRFAKVVIGE